MPDGCKEILIPFTGSKKRKAWNKTREKYMLVKRRQNLAETDRGSYYKEEWLEWVWVRMVCMDFADSYYKIVSPIPLQKLTNDFTVCKLYSGTLLLVEHVSHGFGN